MENEENQKQVSSFSTVPWKSRTLREISTFPPARRRVFRPYKSKKGPRQRTYGVRAKCIPCARSKVFTMSQA
jgi:hypothetical protein